MWNDETLFIENKNGKEGYFKIKKNYSFYIIILDFVFPSFITKGRVKMEDLLEIHRESS